MQRNAKIACSQLPPVVVLWFNKDVNWQAQRVSAQGTKSSQQTSHHSIDFLLWEILFIIYNQDDSSLRPVIRNGRVLTQTIGGPGAQPDLATTSLSHFSFALTQ